MPEDKWEKARQKDIVRKAKRELATGQPSTHDRLSEDTKPLDQLRIRGANTQGRKCTQTKDLRPPQAQFLTKRERYRLLHNLRKNLPNRIDLRKAVETQLSYNEKLAAVKARCTSQAPQKKELTSQILKGYGLNILDLPDAYADAYRITETLVRMVAAEKATANRRVRTKSVSGTTQ